MATKETEGFKRFRSSAQVFNYNLKVAQMTNFSKDPRLFRDKTQFLIQNSLAFPQTLKPTLGKAWGKIILHNFLISIDEFVVMLIVSPADYFPFFIVPQSTNLLSG